MLTFEEMALLDSYLIKRVQEEQERARRTDLALGQQSFGWLKSPKMKLQAIKGFGDKKPQQLRLADFINLCEALGMSWQNEVKEALKQIEKQR